LLGDGAAAAIVEPTPAGQSSRVMGYLVRAFPKAATYAEFRGAGVFRHPNDEKTRREDNMFHMNGTRLFRLGVVQMAALLDNLFTMAGVRSEDIDLVVPHQPSRPALDALGRWGLPPEKIVDILGEYGNCIAASMPMALATAHAQGRLARGKRVLFVGTGAGMSVGGAVVEW
jgi:3-oxoacyl-[acyl-carrier-protein] synthase-3